jgi:hypothetical protein
VSQEHPEEFAGEDEEEEEEEEEEKEGEGDADKEAENDTMDVEMEVTDDEAEDEDPFKPPQVKYYFLLVIRGTCIVFRREADRPFLYHFVDITTCDCGHSLPMICRTQY